MANGTFHERPWQIIEYFRLRRIPPAPLGVYPQHDYFSTHRRGSWESPLFLSRSSSRRRSGERRHDHPRRRHGPHRCPRQRGMYRPYRSYRWCLALRMWHAPLHGGCSCRTPLRVDSAPHGNRNLRPLSPPDKFERSCRRTEDHAHPWGAGVSGRRAGCSCYRSCYSLAGLPPVACPSGARPRADAHDRFTPARRALIQRSLRPIFLTTQTEMSGSRSGDAAGSRCEARSLARGSLWHSTCLVCRASRYVQQL